MAGALEKALDGAAAHADGATGAEHGRLAPASGSAARPGWINALMVFCAYMAFVYVPWDLFLKPVARDEEVWFGILFHGWAAKLTAPPHWAIYAAGLFGFWRMRAWMWPWAAVYAAQVALGMLVWPLLYVGGSSRSLLALVGGARVRRLTLRALAARAPLFGTPRAPLRERYGEWALVTGASAGIGAAFARALAREGISVVLDGAARRPARELASELEKRSACETRVVGEDLADAEGAERVSRAVADLEIAVLVNNAGFGGAGPLRQAQAERLRGMVTLNCVAPVLLTRRLLPRMRERGRGARDLHGLGGGPPAAAAARLYAATQGVRPAARRGALGRAARHGIDVLVLEPGPTETEFQAVAGELPHAGESRRGRWSRRRSTRSGASPRWCRAGSTGCAPTPRSGSRRAACSRSSRSR